MSDLVRRAPDPLRAHGAWVYLGLSLLAGLCLALPHDPLASLGIVALAISGFVATGAVACRRGRSRRLAVAGCLLAIGAVLLFDEPDFGRSLLYGIPGTLLLLVTAWLARRNGFFAPSTLASAVLVLVLAAPACARAGGAPLLSSLLLLALLGPVFAWRSAKLRQAMLREKPAGREALRRIGLREATLSACWTLFVLGLIYAAELVHVLPRAW